MDIASGGLDGEWGRDHDGCEAMTSMLSRRAFLGGYGKTASPVRPPWALPEAQFLDACERCGDCVRVCEERIIRSGAGGYPEISFERAGCTLCGDCLVVCKGRALAAERKSDRPWRHRVAIGDGCLSGVWVVCRSCGEACDSGAIRFLPRVGGPALPNLDLSRCTGCALCLPRCPAGAIRVERESATDGIRN